MRLVMQGKQREKRKTGTFSYLLCRRMFLYVCSFAELSITNEYFIREGELAWENGEMEKMRGEVPGTCRLPTSVSGLRHPTATFN